MGSCRRPHRAGRLVSVLSQAPDLRRLLKGHLEVLLDLVGRDGLLASLVVELVLSEADPISLPLITFASLLKALVSFVISLQEGPRLREVEGLQVNKRVLGIKAAQALNH